MKVAIFVGGYFETAEKFNNIGEARAFQKGVELGATLFHGEDCTVYVLPNDDKIMRDSETAEEVRAAVAYKL